MKYYKCIKSFPNFTIGKIYLHNKKGLVDDAGYTRTYFTTQKLKENRYFVAAAKYGTKLGKILYKECNSLE